MKIWPALILIISLITMLQLTACDLLGLGGSNREREEYERKIEAIKQVQEANRKTQEAHQKALEEYNKRLKEGLEEYYEKYAEYQRQQQEQQLGIDITVSVNQTSDNGSGGAN